MIKLSRKTAETEIDLALELAGNGQYQIDTGIGFFDHMLELWSKHGFFDLTLTVQGDLEVDAHHTVEDTGIVLGQALKEGMATRTGIRRYGQAIIPMDEVLIISAVDLSGRSYYNGNLRFKSKACGDFPVELVDEFFRSLTVRAGINLHFKMLNPGNNHHIIEACFKAFARALDQALQTESRLGDKPLSTKGSLV